MATLLYRCPHCGTAEEIDDALVGDTVRCPACDKPFRPDAPSAQSIPSSELTTEERAGERVEVRVGSSDDERVLLEVHPAMGRKHPLWFLALVTLTVLGALGLITATIFGQGLAINETEIIGVAVLQGLSLIVFLAAALVLFGWWFKTRFVTLSITTKRTVLRNGIISRETSEVGHEDVRNIQVEQNALERMLGIGDLALSSAGQSGLEIHARGIPQPNDVADVIRDMQS
ncbi:MAG: PH domain-containing protein [Planctomycetaceae bacterium]